MLREKQRSQSYICYTPPIRIEEERVLFLIAVPRVGRGGAANLVAIAVQCPESRYAEMKPTFDSIMDSYGKM